MVVATKVWNLGRCLSPCAVPQRGVGQKPRNAWVNNPGLGGSVISERVGQKLGNRASSTGANHITHQLYLPLRSDPSRFDVGAVTLLCGQKVSPGVNLQEASRLQEALGEHAKIEVLKTYRR